VLQFKNRHHPVWRDRYTALFFLDEVTALAAGHRPCFECRRADAKAFAEKWAVAKSDDIPHAPEMDLVLQKERLDGRAKRTYEKPAEELPDGAFIAIGDGAFSLRGKTMLRWSPSCYVETKPRPHGNVTVLTPPSIVAVLSAGYRPQWHPSAD
jgi:hypothetical protein